MPKKDYPEFKSWKKLERYCKKTKTKCYLNDIENGAACRYCYVKISPKNPGKIDPSAPILSYRSISNFFCYKRRICLQCYEKKFARSSRSRQIIISLTFMFAGVFLLLSVAWFKF